MTKSTTTASHLNQRIVLQRLALTWENLWPRLQPALIALALILSLILSGFLALLPDAARLGLIAISTLLMLWSLKPLLSFIWPSRLSAMRVMEQASSVQHRALSARDDQPSVEVSSPAQRLIWEEHQRRQLLNLDAIKIAAPKSAWRKFDPMALRVPAFLLLAATAFLGTGNFSENVKAAVRLSPAVADVALSVDAWVKPPAYTGKPPLLLSGDSMKAALAEGRDIVVPEKSVFTLRVSGADEPSLVALDTAGKALAITGVKATADVLTAEMILDRPITLVLSDGTTEIARYPISTIPDQPPTLSIPNPPKAEARGRVAFDWAVKDDYGVKSLSGEIELADEQAEGIGFDSNGVFLFDAPDVKFALRRGNTKDETGKTTHDLAAHPWAGLKVILTLTAKDGAEQTSTPQTITFDLPERPFIRPMAQALIEQRKRLILNPEKAREVGSLVDALMLYPEGLLERTSHVIAASSLSSRLRNATGYDDVKLVISGLWDLAVAIDEGTLDDARAELQALKKELEKALQDGASPERIAELMDKMRKAMDKFLEAMRQESERRQKDGTASKQKPNPNGKSVSRQDLQKMLDALEGLAKGGAKEQAEKLLSELDRMLQNMQPGQQADGQGGEMGEMLDQLGEMMQRQQGLMDETQRQPGQQGEGEQGEGQEGQEGSEGNRGQGQQGQGQQGQGEGQQGMGGLAERQGALQGMLDGMMGQGQGQMPSELDDASRAMEGAEKSLREGDKEGALQQQGEALDKLRQGANRMAQQMQENGQGQAEGEARDGEGRGRDDDPLGRPRATRNPDTGPDKDMVPTDQAIRRAREILETLRAKSNEQGLSDSERGYIERLLRGLY